MLKLEFPDEAPRSETFTITYSAKENCVSSQEIDRLLKKKVTVDPITEKEDFFSFVFLRIKKDGNYRMILNLKKLNKYIKSKHSKMESLQNVLFIVKGSVWSLWTSNIHTIPTHEKYQKIFKTHLGIFPKIQLCLIAMDCQ